MSSFGEARVDIRLDATRAEAELRALLERAASTVAEIQITVDSSRVAPAVEQAIAAADTEATVTGETRDLTGDVEGAVDAADTQAEVTGDASQLTGDVEGAVDAADTETEVTGDARNVTSAIDSAINAADDDVEVTGDASQVTGAVTSAVNAADTHVEVTADAGGLRDAGNAADNLNTALIASSNSGVRLRTILQLGAAGSVVAGLQQIINTASELEQAIGGTSAVFGEFEGTIATFARGASEAAGLSEEAARVLTSQIGGLLKGFEFTQEEAANTSVALAQLGADLAATFGGRPEEAVQALGAALRGEFDPLERFGISLNITQANLKAVELGLAESTGEVSLNARAQASLALIMERSADAQGQFAREANTTAGQLERARAEAVNAAAAVGATLQPAFNELLATVRADVIPSLQDLGETLGPALARLVLAALPAFGTFTDLLLALTPVINLLATTIDAIPAPVLGMVATFLALRTALGPLTPVVNALIGRLAAMAVPTGAVSGAFSGAATQARGFRGAVSGVAGAISPATAALAVLTVGLTIYSQQQARRAEIDREVAAQQSRLRDALQGTGGTMDGLRSSLDDLIESGDEFASSNFVNRVLLGDLTIGEIFKKAGADVDSLTSALEGGQPKLDAYLDSLASQGGQAEGATAAIRELAEQTVDQAEALLDAGVATNDWTQAQVDSAIAATRASDGSVNYVAALAQLRDAQQAAEAEAEQHEQALTDQEKALQELATTAPAVALTLEALASGGDRSTSMLAAFAVAADEAGLSGDALDAVVARLGSTSGPALQANIEAVAAVIDGVRDAGLRTLPSLQDIAGAVDEFSLSGFRDELDSALDDIRGFNDNLALIAAEGGPRLASAAATLGPQYAGAIAKGIKDGNPQVAAEVELLLAGIEAAGGDTEALLSGTIGPNLAVASGEMGTLATTAFGTNFKIDASGKLVEVQTQISGAGPGVRTRAAEVASGGTSAFEGSFKPSATAGMSGAQTGISNARPGVRTRAEEAGSSGKAGFEGGFKPNPNPALAEAREKIRAAGPLQRKVGEELAKRGADGFGAGAGAFGDAGARAARRGIAGVVNQRGAAYSGGYSVGVALGQGMSAGVSAAAGRVAAAAASLVSSAVSSARRAARISSPSQLFAEQVGLPISEGVALGVEQGSAEVAAAVRDVVAVASRFDTAAGDGTRRIMVDGGVGVRALAAAGAGTAAAGDTRTFIVEDGAVRIILPAGTDRRDVVAAGAAAERGIERAMRFAARMT